MILETGSAEELLNGPYFHNSFFKLLVGNDGFVFDPCFVSVDGIDGILKDMGDLFIFVNTHPGQGKYPQIGI